MNAAYSNTIHYTELKLYSSAHGKTKVKIKS